MTDAHAPIRVAIQQGSLAKYRVPVFRELANRPGIDLELLYGARAGIPTIDADGFQATLVPFREVRVRRTPAYWHQAQLKAVSRRRADVAILSWDIHYASLMPALLRSKLSGVRTVLWGHGYSKRERAWRRRARNAFGRRSTALMFYNHGTKTQFTAEGWDENRLFVALNSLDQAPIQQAREEWEAAPNRLDEFVDQHQLRGECVLLYVSRFDARNRVDLLIEAVAQLRKQGVPAVAALVGKVEPDMSRLQQLAADLHVAPFVRFLGAIYDESELAPWFLSAKLFVYPANIGLSLLHAFGYRLPVVTSSDQASQNPEIEALQHEDNGLLYEQGDATALASAIARAVGDESWLTRARNSAEATVRDRFNLQTMVDGMEAAIRYCAHQQG